MTESKLDENKVWIDGCFDFTHHGHAGAILQARRTIPQGMKTGELFCGVHSDEAISINKGKPVMNSAERYEHTRSNRWCSYVVEDAPYVTQPEVLNDYGCKYVVHGDDITLDANGEDCYQVMKNLGRFKVVKRTVGVSTTDIIHRMLTGEYIYDNSLPDIELIKMYASDKDGFSTKCFVYKHNFEEILVEGKILTHEQNIIISGDFDLFHMGHIEQLSKINELYPNYNVIIGLNLNDENDNKTIMSLTERLLSVLSCKYIDGIIIEPKFDQINDKIIKIDSTELVKNGKFSEYLTKQTIIDRIKNDRQIYISRNEKKGMVYN